MSDLVTGEAVVLELRLAKLASRTLAILIDFAIQFTALFIFSFLAGALGLVLDTAALEAISLTGTVIVLVGYFVAMETLTRGRTVGKIALGLRVVRDDGGPIRFRHALARGLATLVDFYLLLGSVAMITSLASSRGKRVGDLLAGTVVVRERVPVRGAPIAQMPPPLAGWAPRLQLSRLPDDLALAARQFLARTHELAPQARNEMGVRLANEVSRYVSPPPPMGTPPEPYLAAVLVERRAREWSRLGGPVHAAPTPYGRTAPSPPPPPPPAPTTTYEHPTVPFERPTMRQPWERPTEKLPGLGQERIAATSPGTRPAQWADGSPAAENEREESPPPSGGFVAPG